MRHESFHIPGQPVHENERGARVWCEKTGRIFESADLNLTWGCNVVEALRKMRQADPRLAELPEDLRAVVAEFLTLHDAWQTEFRARADQGFLEIGWETVWPGTVHLQSTARFRFEGRHQSFYIERWGIEYKESARVEGPWSWGRTGSQDPDAPLRRSADFAEFVQRFAVPS